MRTGLRFIKSLSIRRGMAPKLLLLSGLSVGAALLDGASMGLLLPVVQGLQRHMGSASIGQDHASSLIDAAFAWAGLPQTLPTVLGVALLVFVGQAVSAYVRVLLTSWWQNQLVLSMRGEAFGNLLDFDLDFFHRSRAGALINTLITEAYRAGYAFRSMVEMFAALCVLAVYAAVELAISWQMALIAFPTLGLVAMALRPRQSYELGVEYSHGQDILQATAVESLGGIREIKSLGIGRLISDRFLTAAESVSRLDFRLIEKSARFSFAYQITVFMLVVGLVLLLSRSAGLSMGAFVVFLVILQRLAPRVGVFAEQRHVWLGTAGSMEKIEALLAQTTHAQKSVTSGTVPFWKLERRIEFREVRFQHVGEPGDILRGVSFTLPRGQSVAVVGPSGSGKSTLLDLLARFYDPTGGAILIDDQDLRGLDLESWRRCLGLVSQDTFLFNDTIEHNIRLGLVDASHEKIVDAARLAHAHEFIAGLPQGYETIVGDRGSRLSGGQRQRIALARALLRRPQVLILDEATSQLDSESEHAIQQAIRELRNNCTILLAAHRLSTVRDADLTVVLENGVVVEAGPCETLLAAGGRYAEFHRAQFTERPAVFG